MSEQDYQEAWLAIPQFQQLWLRSFKSKRFGRRAAAEMGGVSQTFRFDQEGVTFASTVRRHELQWNALKQHIESPASFLIFTGKGSFLLVPKRAFSDDDVETLREMLQERIPTRPVVVRQLDPTSFGRAPLLLWVVVLIVFLAGWHFLSMLDSP